MSFMQLKCFVYQDAKVFNGRSSKDSHKIELKSEYELAKMKSDDCGKILFLGPK